MLPTDRNRDQAAPETSPAGQPLAAEDLRILALENETVAGHTCKVITLDGPLDVGLLRSSIAARLHLAPRLRRRLGEIDGAPWWVPDPHVDVSAQVVESDLAGPLDESGLRAAVADIFGQHLDRSRPLWRIDLLPRLADGGSALIWRIHHALADGQTAMRMANAVLWDEDAAVSGSRAPGAGSAARTTADAGPQAGAGTPVTSQGGHHRLDGLRAIAREAPQPWLRSPFDGHIDGCRSVAFATASLAGLKRAAAAADGATVNDAVLSVVAGGLRRWLEAHHGHLGTVRVKVPVSLHGPSGDGRADPGNRDSFFCLDLPLGSADPVERLSAIRAETRVRKQGHDAQHLDAVMRQLAHAPRLGQFVERVLSHSRSFAVNVSNVPGPRRPVQVLGIPVRELHSLAEIREHHALRVAVVSLADTLNFGLVADPTLVADVGRLADGLQAEAAMLTG